MTDINLLPPDMRRLEEKERERLAKKPKVFEIDLTSPAKGKQAPITKQVKPKVSFWKNIFGEAKSRPTPPMANGNMAKSDFGVDLLSASRKQKTIYTPIKSAVLPASVKKPEHNSFALTRSAASRPIAPAPVTSTFKPSMNMNLLDKKVITKEKTLMFDWLKKLFAPQPNKAKPAIQPTPRPQPEPVIMPSRPSLDLNKSIKPIAREHRAKAPSAGWWAIFESLFAPQSHKPATVASTPVIKANDKKTKKEKYSAFHLAPKAGKPGLSINLMPEDLAFHPQLNSSRRILAIILAIVIPGILVYGAYYLMNSYQMRLSQQLAERKQTIAGIKANIKMFQQKQKQNGDMEDRLIAIKKLLSEKVYWSKFFAGLEKYTLDGVYYTDLKVDTSGVFVLPAVATDYETAVKQLTAFEQAKDFAKEVKSSSFSLHSEEKKGVTGVGFQIKIQLSDKVLKK